ncbi:hypothetical protein RND81_12G065800 [Saponaria officinalis]|uniref:J domain-containing protein required for chloroplast accumulation response 1 n=1 Tax=Saponaria officinalis TaxID=3572 RepID=A0AAW1H7C8_SAPOF
MLGYNSPSHLSDSQSRNSDDVDFSDVFGGPPRRSSTQDSSHSARNSNSFDDNDDTADVGPSWLTSREKPVFGEVAGVRRRYGSDDFFDDIFRGDQPSSSCQSPRVVPRRSPFSSAPGSRVMSPSRSLPSAETSANPTKFSLPGRLSNTDFVASASMNQSFFSPSLSRFNHTTENRDVYNRSSTQYSDLQSRDTVNVKDSNSRSQTDGNTDQSDNHGNAKGSEFPIYATNFHFSIYKWANKGVPLVVSLRKKSTRSKEATKLDDLFSDKSVTPSSPAKEREQRSDSFVSSVIAEAAKIKKDDNSPDEFDCTPIIGLSNEVDRVREVDSSGGVKDATVQHNLFSRDSGFEAHKRNDPPKLVPKTKSNMKSFRSFHSQPNEGNEKDITEKTRTKVSKVKEKQKPYPIDEVRSHTVGKTKVQKSSPPAKNDARTSATRTVQDFVNIFSHEYPLKASSPRLRQSHSHSRRRKDDPKNVEVDYEIRFSSARMNDETEASFVNWGEECPDTSEMEDEHSTQSRSRIPDPVKQTSANAPSVDSIRDCTTNIDAALIQDEVPDYETKVLQWSRGKESNIRALLSTLQYVLWPDSGWKSIPLVDIIEANAVKRAYQKALLRLHPDKLQQKGAPLHHKLIAEKVFDILQLGINSFHSTLFESI